MPASEIAIAGLSGNQVDVIQKATNTLVTYNPDEENAFGWTTVTADIAGGETALFITNVSSAQHLHIKRLYIFSDKHTQILLTLPPFAAFTGTAVVGVPLNRAGARVAPATAYADETGNDSSNVFARISTNELDTGQFGEWVELDGQVILGHRDSIGIDIVVDGAAFYAFVLGYFHDN